MTLYHGSCHCGAIKFEVEADLSKITRCTCSICRKKGALLTRAKPSDLRIVEGEEAMALYQFNKKIAKHYFCAECGVHTFGHPRAAPDMLVINVNTLDDFDVNEATYELNIFDGKNWEDAFARSQQAK